MQKILLIKRGESYFSLSVNHVHDALKQIYGGNEILFQQLPATFRCGDLIAKLLNINSGGEKS